jgi:hypothetical protein
MHMSKVIDLSTQPYGESTHCSAGLNLGPSTIHERLGKCLGSAISDSRALNRFSHVSWGTLCLNLSRDEIYKIQ